MLLSFAAGYSFGVFEFVFKSFARGGRDFLELDIRVGNNAGLLKLGEALVLPNFGVPFLLAGLLDLGELFFIMPPFFCMAEP